MALHLTRSRHTPRLGLALPLLLLQGLLPGHRYQKEACLESVFTLTNDDLWKLHPWGASMNAFDVSPDGKTFAAQFEALQEGGKAALWVAEWDVATRRLVGERTVEGPEPTKQFLLSAQYRFDLRFTPDGRRLVALTGPRVEVLDAAKLELLYTILPGAIDPAPSEGDVIRQFVTSSDNRRLAIFSTAAMLGAQPINVCLFEIGTGTEVAHWTLDRPLCGGFSLSPDGGELLMSQPTSQPATDDLTVLDSRRGNVLRAFDSGLHGSACGFGPYAEFLDTDDLLVATPIFSAGSHHALEVMDAHTGKVVRDLGYVKHDARADMAAATRARVIAAFVFSWKRGIGSDLDAPFTRPVNWLALFRPGDSEPFYVRPNVRMFEGYPGMRGALRISQDGKVVAFGAERTLYVYRVESQVPSR